ncbi:LPS export ABC transporter periplasmic protein LptC [Pseudoteredinibacter isoporae]|uniref:LPS export ABC transporter periplasmic protein LptC n=1 Tax=Pseudoteredinibacter isoporae TaxID=570281 RepID=UPI0031057F39
MPKHWISLLLLIALTVLFLVIWESPPALLSGAKKDSKAEFPAAYMIDSHSQHFDESGHLDYEIKAAKVVHYQVTPGRQQDNDHADITSPEITLHAPGRQPWYIRAKTGRSNSDGSKIILTKDVEGWQENDDGQRNELNTDELVIHTKRDYVETDKAVIITSGGHTIKAIGLEANLNKETLRLKQRVRGVHEF